MKVASWNIAGGHPIASLGHFDYLREDIQYFISEIKKIDPDIICLQESHTSVDGTVSNASQIAEALGYTYVFNSPASTSHIEEGFMLSTAILSKAPFVNQTATFFPNPSAPLVWKHDGKSAAAIHEKNLQTVRLEDFTVANNQMLPLPLFGLGYDDGAVGQELARGIDAVMAKSVSSPVVWCGDFNWQDPLSIYPHMRSLQLADALPDEATRPSADGAKKRPDHIFYSPEFSLLNSGVIKTNSDHYLCWAELHLN